MKEIKGELLMIWGRQDPPVPKESRALIYKAMRVRSISERTGEPRQSCGAGRG